MTVKNSNLDGILAELTRRKTAAEQGDKDTSHPSAKAPNSTQDASTGARAAESSADLKEQQPLGVENAGEPTDRENPSGSMGVDDKKSDEGAAMDTGDTSGVSEMANKDTTHPIKNASALEKAAAALDLLTKAIEQAGTPDKTAADKAAADKAAADKAAADKTAAEKLAAYVKDLEQNEGEAVKAGEKFAEHVLTKLASLAQGQEKQAAELFERKAVLKHILKTAAGEDLAAMGGEEGIDQAAGQMAEQGVSPEELTAALQQEAGGPEAGQQLSIEELAAALEQAGVSPEELEGLAAQEELGEDEQGAALDEAMTETGTTPEDIAAAGGQVPEGLVGKAASVKIAAAKTAAYQAFKNQLVRELNALKGATK